MKKIILLGLTVLLGFSLSACGGNSNQKTDNQLTLGKTNSIENYADFSLFKVVTTKKITASISDDFYYENTDDGKTYVDMVLDWTNKSDQTQNSDSIIVASANNSNGTEYNDCMYAIETDNSTNITKNENIVSQSTIRLHCAISVPETEKDLDITLVVDSKEYTYKYTLGKTASNAKEIKVDDTINEDDYAKMVFKGIDYTDDLKPTNTNGAYTHYAVDNSNNTYLVVKFDLTNLQNSEKDCDSFIGVKAMYMDKYNYSGFLVAEDEDEKGFSSYASIAPLSSRNIYYLISVPKTVSDNKVNLTITFNGNEYTYSE